MQKAPTKKFSEYLEVRGLRSTSQRNAIFEIFVEAKRHMSAEELYARVKKKHPGIGYATVYRTLKLLSEAGLAKENRFENGFARFEYNYAGEHHDHLVCTKCGLIIEFENKRIEALQQDVAMKNGFTVQNHKLELYGVCAKCQQREGGNHRKTAKATE